MDKKEVKEALATLRQAAKVAQKPLKYFAQKANGEEINFKVEGTSQDKGLWETFNIFKAFGTGTPEPEAILDELSWQGKIYEKAAAAYESLEKFAAENPNIARACRNTFELAGYAFEAVIYTNIAAASAAFCNMGAPVCLAGGILTYESFKHFFSQGMDQINTQMAHHAATLGRTPEEKARFERVVYNLHPADMVAAFAVPMGFKAFKGTKKSAPKADKVEKLLKADKVEKAEKVSKAEPKSASQAEKYKRDLREEMGKPHAEDPKLKDFLTEYHRKEENCVGSGSTAAAARHEILTGEQVGGVDHIQKAHDSVRYLEKWLNNNPTATPGDRAAAENVLADLKDALSTIKGGQ